MQACLRITESSIACLSASGQYSGCGGVSGKRFARRVVVTVAIHLKTHWEEVYSAKGATGVSWYQSEPRLSLELIRELAPTARVGIIDVGGGASLLVDRLLDLPFEKIAVLDIAETALRQARSRLGERAGRVE